MNRFHGLLIVATFVCSLPAYSRDVAVTYDLLKKGRALSAKDAEKLEERLKKNTKNEEARVQLLSYYAVPPSGVDLATAKAARARHVLWLIEADPKEGLGLFQVSTGVYRLNCQGDDLADPAAFNRASELWLKQIQKNHGNTEVRREAVDAIQFCSPEQAESILIDAHDEAGLGRLYASAVLGITGQSYTNSDPSGSDPLLRERPFAVKAREILEETKSREVLVAGAVSLLRDGAILWADGKLDWDYTPFGNRILARAKGAAPDAMTLFTVPTALPARGERPPATLRIGGNVQSARLVRKLPPAYPIDARDAGIEGTVRMTALIGLEGNVLYLHAESGPPELVPASLEAVRQWQYKPTLLNGKPCYVVTLIDIKYTLSPQ